MWLALLLASLAFSETLAVWNEDVGPWYKATKGELLPLARSRNVQEAFMIVQPNTFRFRVTGQSCDIIDYAMDRYKNIMMNDAKIAQKAALTIPETYVLQSPHLRGELVSLEIHLVNPCEKLPHLHMNENYTLVISESTKSGVLTANEVWGILRGLESFSQLIAASSDGHLTIKCQEISDSPRFPHRGFLLDTSRHYFPVSDIMLTLDALAYNKYNVFHWHIVDDNSFPYVGKVHPELAEKGAYHPTMIYTPSNVRDIVEYARLRGIRVIAEFDTPAHTKSWGRSHPEILTECYQNGKPNGKLGPMDPTKDELYTFLESMFNEILAEFPDRHVHLGGDEVDFKCWASNPNVTEYMKKRGYGKDFKALEAEFFHKLLPIPKRSNVDSIVWEEVYKNVADLPTETIVQVWNEPWEGLMNEVLSKNHRALLSSCWYLSVLASGADWVKFYTCDPLSFKGTPEMKSRVLGGEACMWGEYVDSMNVHQRVWPRASVIAERLWSYETESIDLVSKRLEEHSCRMNRRGVPAQPPNGSGFCVL